MSQLGALPRAAVVALSMAFGAWSVQAADIVDTAEDLGRFGGFLRLVEAAGLTDTLRGEGPLTVFAPTDEAIDRLPPGLLDRLVAAEDRETIEAIVQAHIVADAAIGAEDLLGRAVEVATLGGGTLAIDGTTAVIMVAPIEVAITEVEGPGADRPVIPAAAVAAGAASDPHADGPAMLVTPEMTGVATVVAPDIEADNGVLHGIDLVLVPPDALWSF